MAEGKSTQDAVDSLMENLMKIRDSFPQTSGSFTVRTQGDISIEGKFDGYEDSVTIVVPSLVITYASKRKETAKTK